MISARILRLMEGRSVAVPWIAQRMNHDPRAVSTLLQMLKRQGKVENDGQVWSLKS